MAKYQKYAEYKDSGEDFLPILPSSWEVSRVKKLMTLQRSIVGNKSSSYQLLSLTLKGVIPRDISNGDGKIPESFDTYQVVKADDLVCCLFDMDETPRTIGIAEQKGMITGAYNVYTVKQDNFPRYIYYYFLYLDYFKGLKPYYTGLRKVVRADTFANIKMPCPSFFEQIKIANFLDHETAQIDSLIAKQEKLIELLKEKRQAVISHAVTKGLNPDVNMKDSGVEWLGQVPEHWKCIKIKHITTTFEQGWSPQCDSRPAESHEYGVLKVGCVNGGSFRSSENKALPPELEPRLQYLIQKDDLLISRANTKELVGSASVVNGDYPNLILCDKLYRLRFSKNVLPEMVSLYLSIGAVRKQIELGATGASHSMQNIGQDTIKELYYLLPPYEEALNILESIKQSNQKFDELTKKAESAIQLMQERRTALISSVVTGKIDVRNWQYPNKATTELSQ